MKLVVKALLDVVESGNKNIEMMVMNEKGPHVLTDEEIDKLIELSKEWLSGNGYWRSYEILIWEYKDYEIK